MGKTTHIRVDKILLEKKKVNYPDMTANDIFKLGLSTLNGINTAGKLVWGVTWDKRYGKKNR